MSLIVLSLWWNFFSSPTFHHVHKIYYSVSCWILCHPALPFPPFNNLRSRTNLITSNFLHKKVVTLFSSCLKHRHSKRRGLCWCGYFPTAHNTSSLLQEVPPSALYQSFMELLFSNFHNKHCTRGVMNDFWGHGLNEMRLLLLPLHLSFVASCMQLLPWGTPLPVSPCVGSSTSLSVVTGVQIIPSVSWYSFYSMFQTLDQ